jgi:hypothetical protein
MVKFAKQEEKPFSPLEKHTLNAVAAPVREEPSPAPSKSELSPEPESEAPKSSPARPKQAAAKRSRPKKVTSPPGRGERLTRAVKCLFTPSEEMQLRSLVARLAEAAGTSLTFSHLMRPYFDLLLHCEEQLTEELKRAGITRPLNDKTALAYFEQQLAEVIQSALRRAPLLRADRLDSEE